MKAIEGAYPKDRVTDVTSVAQHKADENLKPTSTLESVPKHFKNVSLIDIYFLYIDEEFQPDYEELSEVALDKIHTLLNTLDKTSIDLGVEQRE